MCGRLRLLKNERLVLLVTKPCALKPLSLEGLEGLEAGLQILGLGSVPSFCFEDLHLLSEDTEPAKRSENKRMIAIETC